MKRPLAYSGAAFFLTLLVVNILGVNFAKSVGIVLFVVALVIGFLPSLKHSRIWAIPVFCGFLASLIFFLGTNIFVIPIEKELSGKTMRVNATLIDLPSQGDFPVYTVKSDIEFPDGKTKSVKYKFYSTEEIECEPYDILICDVEFIKIEDDFTNSSYAENIFINSKLVSVFEVIPTTKKPVAYHILKVREHLISVMVNTFDEHSAGLICGVMTGDKSYMPPALKENIRISGLSHITAVSGLHISILASFIMFFLQKGGLKKRYSYLLTLIPVWIFVLLVGMPYSTIRSAFMFSVMALGMGIFQHNDPFSSLFGSLMLCGLVSPFCALDVGLLSSASATFGLILLAKPLNQWMLLRVHHKLRDKNWIKYIVSSFAQTVSAVAGLLPCILIFYKNFSLVVLISNLTVLPLITVLLFCSLLGGILSFAPVIANPFLLVAGIVSKIVILLCNLFANIPFAEISVARGYLIVSLCGCMFLFVVAMVMFTLNKGGRRIISLLLVSCLLFVGVSSAMFHIVNRNSVEIFVPDDSDGVYALVIYKGEISLICGEIKYSSPNNIYSTLKSLGYGKIDNFITQDCISREKLERISKKINIKRYFVHKELESVFPVVVAKGKEVTFVSNTLVTKEGVKIDFARTRSETLVTVGTFSLLLLNRNLDFGTPVFLETDLVVSGKRALNKLKYLTFYNAVCSCGEEDVEDVLTFFEDNNVKGVYTAGYGGIRIWAKNTGEYSLYRIE